jgi:hypothetical protein
MYAVPQILYKTLYTGREKTYNLQGRICGAGRRPRIKLPSMFSPGSI